MPPKHPTLLSRPAALIAIFAVLQLCVAFFTESQNFTHEESMWHYIGRNWFRHGLTPYAGGVDNKSPLIFAVYGLSDILFGLNYWFPRIIGVIVQSVGLVFIYRIALQLTKDTKTAEITLTLYGLSILWHATGGKYVSFTETYAVTFMLGAVYYYVGNKSFTSGLLAGIAACWRISALFGIIAIIVHALIKRRNSIIPFIAGLITAIGAFALLAMAAGIDLHELYIYTIGDNFSSGSTTDHPFSWQLQRFFDSFFKSELVLFYAPLVAYFFIKKQHSLLTIWLICEFIGINALSIYAYPHFKQLLPPLCLISAIAIAQLPFKHVMIAIWIIFFPKATEPLTGFKKMISPPPLQNSCTSRPNEQAEKELGLWIKQNTKPKDKVLVAGFGARVQLYSERLSPSIYFNVTQTPRAKEKFMQEVNESKPQLIAIPAFPDYKVHVSADLRNFIDSLAAQNYSRTQCRFGYYIYVNSSSASF